MKVPHSVIARFVVAAGAVAVSLAASANAQSTPNSTDAAEGVTHPGRLVESATPNTGMVIPDWNDEASVHTPHQTKSEPTLQTESDDELNERIGASRGRPIQPPTITSISTSRQDPPNGVGDPVGTESSDDERRLPLRDEHSFDAAGESDSTATRDVQPAGHDGGHPERQADNGQDTDASASTVIPRPGVVEPSASGESAVVPRSAIDAPWYRHPAIALFVVIVGIVGVAMVFRKYVPSSRMIPMHAVRVVGRAPISAKHSIALLHVGQRLLVVGMTADRVSTLSEITDPQEVSLLLGATGGADASADVFGAQLADQIGQFAVGDADDLGSAGDMEDRSLLNETKGQLQSLMRKLRSLRAA